MRGRHRSEPLERIIREAQQLEAAGAKEICLVAQDLAHYGRDLGRSGPDLPELLRGLLPPVARDEDGPAEAPGAPGHDPREGAVAAIRHSRNRRPDDGNSGIPGGDGG